MKKVLVACCSDPRQDPRPWRMIEWLKGEYEVTVAAVAPELEIEGVRCVTVPAAGAAAPPERSGWYRALKRVGWLRRCVQRVRGVVGPATVKRAADVALRRFEKVAWEQIEEFRVCEPLGESEFDLIISHDVVILPLLFEVRKGAKVMLDAREFYPRNYEDQLRWRLLSRPVLDYLCREYLPRCDKVMTVCEGLAAEFGRCYGVRPEVLMSLPRYYGGEPSAPEAGAVRMIHHGHAGVSRRIEVMIRMMDAVDERFSLDLMVIRNQPDYWAMLERMAASRKNVRLIPPVAMGEIVPLTNAYDVGLFLCPPSNFNLRFALPNKLFEFIQARLLVAIGPSPEMRKIVEQYGCGIVAEDFEPATLARELNRLTPETLMAYKERSHAAARELNADVNRPKALAMVRELIGK